MSIGGAFLFSSPLTSVALPPLEIAASPPRVVTLLHEIFVEDMTMPTTTISSREFNQDTSGAKKASRNGPVIITDRGRPAHVLLSIEDYEKLSGLNTSIVDMLVMPEAPEIDFETERATIIPREIDLS